MKKILKLIFVILGIIFVKLVFTFTINEIIIWNFNNNIYNTHLIKIFYPFNFNQSYIVFYNNGNLLYKKGKYTEAIEKYKKSIDKNPPQSRICDVRINLSLSMIKEIDDTFDYKAAYDQLEDAKNNLYNNNCANAIDNSGYSQDAEKLEEEIKKLQDQLNNSTNNNKKQDNREQENNKEEQEDYSDIEEELKEIEKQSNANRQSDMTTYENIGDYSYYSGKRW
jgi:tetratricopeptide (TPR) repeat protein